MSARHSQARRETTEHRKFAWGLDDDGGHYWRKRKSTQQPNRSCYPDGYVGGDRGGGGSARPRPQASDLVGRQDGTSTADRNDAPQREIPSEHFRHRAAR